MIPGKPEPSLRELAEYASRIADDAQVRKISSACGDPVKLYDDFWWQSVMDFIRYELARQADKYEPRT